MKKRKRLIVDVDEETFREFKDRCKLLGASMSEVVLLGLEAGLEAYTNKEIAKLRKEQDKLNNFCKTFKFKGD